MEPGAYVIQELKVRDETKILNDVGKKFGKKFKNTCALLYSINEDAKSKIIIRAIVPKKLSKKVCAKDWVETIVPLIEGGCGGSPAAASAAGKDISKLNDVLKALES